MIRLEPRQSGNGLAHSVWTVLAVLGICCASAVDPAAAEDHIVFHRDGAKVHVSGRILVEAEDGGVLLMDRTGRLYTAQPEEIVQRSSDDVPYRPLDADALGKSLLRELPEGFKIHTTAHYLICYNTSPAYAQWCGSLFERLYRAFKNLWSRRGLDLQDPPMPLVAIVFADVESYRRYAVHELGDAVESIIGYYNLLTNRVAMYDLTGAQAVRRSGDRQRSSVEINRVLSRPEAGSLVATIIHEATHQIAFNCGLQARLADIPTWVSEGIAMYFETPDLGRSDGWRGIGALNRSRLLQFRKYHKSRPTDSLALLLSSDDRIKGRSQDKRFQGRDGVLNAYAEAWCLTYYLVKHHPKEFVAYLKHLSAKPPLDEDTPEQRIAEFTRFFGDLDSLDKHFLRQISRLR